MRTTVRALTSGFVLALALGATSVTPAQGAPTLELGVSPGVSVTANGPWLCRLLPSLPWCR